MSYNNYLKFYCAGSVNEKVIMMTYSARYICLLVVFRGTSTRQNEWIKKTEKKMPLIRL